jgi:photosystem II stability/assembly factor-like uncharacterized protein
VYAATRGISNNGDAPWNGVIYSSSDGGQSWSPSLYDVGGIDIQDWAYSLCFNPNNHEQVFAALHQTGPYLKDNNGWHWIPDGANPTGRSIVISPQPDYASTRYYGVWRFDLDPVGSVFKTTNSGKTWKDVSQDMGELKVYSMAIDPYDSANTLYMATFTRGVLKTTDGSETWQLAGMQTDPLYSIAINPSMTNNLFTGTSGDGLYRSMDFTRTPGSEATRESTMPW